MKLRTSLLLSLLVVALDNCEGYRILGIFSNAAKSHHVIGEVLFKALAAKGHEVTMVSPFPLEKPVPRYKDVELYGFVEMMRGREKEFSTIRKNLFAGIKFVLNITREFTEETLRHPEVRKLILKTQHKYDAVVIDWFLNDAALIFGHVFKAPVVLISSLGATEGVNNVVANPSPFSYVPAKGSSYGSDMTFLERVSNTLNILFWNSILGYNRDYHHSILKRYFEKLPDFEVLAENVALVLSNGHYSFESPRPYVPNMIPVGGFHVEKPKPLPKNIKNFLDGAKNGAVYFSLGSHMKSIYLPEEKVNAILSAFSKVPLRVLWKWEDANLTNKPENVMTSSWFPQNDILAHPNVKVFITHGGLLSTIETVHHGVPMIGIPIFGDQGANIARAEDSGFGIKITLDDLSESKLLEALDKAVNDTSYSNSAKKRSRLLKDQPMEPMQTAIFWIEHVIRNGGGEHLRNGGTKLAWYQYLLLDVIAFLIAISAILLTGTFVVARYIFKAISKIKVFHRHRKLKKQVRGGRSGKKNK